MPMNYAQTLAHELGALDARDVTACLDADVNRKDPPGERHHRCAGRLAIPRGGPE